MRLGLNSLKEKIVLNLKNRLFEIILILLISAVIGLARNHFNPKGIALFGQWNKDNGVVSALSKDSPVIEESLEIKSVEEARKIYDKGDTLFVDARGSEAFKEGRVKGAVSLPVDDFKDKGPAFLEKYGPETKIIVYCSGRECEDSHTLAGFLKDLGYKGVRVMIDGLPGWENGGNPVEKN